MSSRDPYEETLQRECNTGRANVRPKMFETNRISADPADHSIRVDN